MTPTLFPLSLRLHYPTCVDVKIDENTSTPHGKLGVTQSVFAAHNRDNSLDWRLQLDLNFWAGDPEKPTVSGHIIYVGYFELPSDMKDEIKPKFVSSNGAGILYAATRELILTITSRVPNRLVTLPPTSFAGLTVKPVGGEVAVANEI